MDEKEKNEIINDAREAAPQEIKDEMEFGIWKDEVSDICQKFNLSADKIEKVQAETSYVMLGLENIVDHAQNIMLEAEIPVEGAIKIAREIREKIFSKIYEQLINYEFDEVSEDEEGLSPEDQSNSDPKDDENEKERELLEKLNRSDKVEPETETDRPKSSEENIKEEKPAYKNIAEENLRKNPDPYREPIE